MKRSSRYDAYYAIRQMEREERYRKSGRITLAGPKPKPQAREPIYRGNERKHMISKIIDTLADWRLSPFENEGPAHAAVRSALCGNGYGWVRSDEEADDLVKEGLRRIGAKRPSWDAGQWHYTDSPDSCSWCKGPIDEESRTRSQRFCSSVCAKSALEHRVYETVRRNDRVAASAYRLINRLASPPRPCQWCGAAFQSDKRDVVHCSPSCARLSKGDGLADRNCLWCGETFHPLDHSMVCCSKPCAGHHNVRVFRETAPERSCVQCSGVFRARWVNDKYCSTTCAGTARNSKFRAERADKRQALVDQVRSCEWCSRPFAGRGPFAKSCSKTCAANLANARAGKFPKRVTPPVFDFLARRQGARITEAERIAA